MYYYKHHIGDFRAGTANLTRHERWLYRDMLDMYYDKEKPLPESVERIADELGATIEEHVLIAKILRLKFKPTNNPAGTQWVNERCETELCTYKEAGERARENGKKGGRKPRNNPVGSQRVASGNPADTSKEPSGPPSHKLTINHKPLTKNQEPETKNQRVLEPVNQVLPFGSVETLKGEEKKIKKEIAPASPLPDFVNPEFWKDFCVMKQKIHGTKWSQSMHDHNLRQLIKLHDQGHDANAIIETTLANGWKGFFATQPISSTKTSTVVVNGVKRSKEFAETVEAANRWMGNFRSENE